MTLHDHRPHKPWGGVVGLIRRHRDEDDRPTAELEPVTDDSIHAWLNPPNTGPDDLAGVSRMPFTVHPVSPASPVDLPGSPLMLESQQVTVYRELDDDEAFAARLLAMEREAQADADLLEGENDTRMTLLLARSRAFGDRWAQTKLAIVFGRRRERIRELVPALGHLLASGDVSQDAAAFVMLLRSRFLSFPEPSQYLPKLTPELLARLDAEKAAEVVVHAPRCEYDGCIGHIAMPDPEGGYEVELPGCPRWLHFEASELEFTAAGAR